MRADTAAQGRHLASLSLGALGVVFGDIGTSPLYALRECFRAEHGLAPTPANVLGLLSLIIWSLVLVVSVKYVAFVMRADNRGEGGILALLALTSPRVRGTATVTLGLFGAALLYGDGVITPAISVLAAVEGIKVVAPPFTHWVVPVAIGLLLLLFTVQKRGTARMGRMFGPVMLVWFAAIAILGGVEVARSPDVLWGLTPGMRRASSSTTDWRASSCWVPSSWPSPAWRRSMPTWATSADGRSGWSGLPWCYRHSC
jgi:KUP system potassium uptake protein